MHETAAIAASVGPTVVILIVILFGILYNQHGLDKLEGRLDVRIDNIESRLDKIQAGLNSFHRSLGQHDKALEILEKRAS